MRCPVHILVTVRKPELLPAALLVFRTLRVGFPTAPVYVWGNALDPASALAVSHAAERCGARFNNLQPTVHDAWIEQLVLYQAQPYWICDTDMVFFEAVEWWLGPTDTELFAGRFEPAWYEPWGQSRHVERLHTCLQWHNPAALRAAMLRWCREKVPAVWHSGQTTFIRQNWLPSREGTILYDTTAGLWQAGWGTKFSAVANEAFEHLHAGTYADEVSKCPTFAGMPALHQRIYADPQAARGLQKLQAEFYEYNKPA